jgi:hypothetical protein
MKHTMSYGCRRRQVNGGLFGVSKHRDTFSLTSQDVPGKTVNKTRTWNGFYHRRMQAERIGLGFRTSWDWTVRGWILCLTRAPPSLHQGLGTTGNTHQLLNDEAVRKNA